MLLQTAMELVGLMLVLLAAAIIALPAWPYSAKWGMVPTGACGIVALVTAALILVGRL